MSVRLCVLLAAVGTAMGLACGCWSPSSRPILNFSAGWNIGIRSLPTSSKNGLSGRGSLAAAFSA